jgi:Icc-related predicted phosphoesterase
VYCGKLATRKILVVSDLHGSRMAYGKLANAPKIYGCDMVILAGDLTGKAVVPIVRRGDGTYDVVIFGDPKVIKESELEGTIKTIEMSGYYTAVMDKNEYEEVAGNKEKIHELFLRVEKEKLGEMLDLIEMKFKREDVKLFAMPGNDDSDSISNFVRDYSERSRTFIDIDEGIANFDDLQLLGFGYSNKTPWNSPRELSEGEIYERLSSLFERSDLSRMKHTIAVIHVPPAGTVIDKAPELTQDLRPIIRGGDAVLKSVGSVSVRSIIEQYSPMLGVHGHIHESPGVDHIRVSSTSKVPVLNAGSEYQDGVLRGALIAISDSAVENVLLTRG